MECKWQKTDREYADDLVLIETLWNVNVPSQPFSMPLHACFNRNIVECKYGKVKFIISGHTRFNRNIVECKCSPLRFADGIRRVLIETLWNVN